MGLSLTQIAGMKPPGTPPTAADPALPIALSPDSLAVFVEILGEMKRHTILLQRLLAETTAVTLDLDEIDQQKDQQR